MPGISWVVVVVMDSGSVFVCSLSVTTGFVIYQFVPKSREVSCSSASPSLLLHSVCTRTLRLLWAYALGFSFLIVEPLFQLSGRALSPPSLAP